MANLDGTHTHLIPESEKNYIFNAVSLGIKHRDIAKDLSKRLGIVVAPQTISQRINDWRQEARETMLDNIQQQVAPALSTDLDKVDMVISLFADKVIARTNSNDDKGATMYANTMLSYVKYRASTVGIGDGKPVKEYADHLQEAMALVSAAAKQLSDNTNLLTAEIPDIKLDS